MILSVCKQHSNFSTWMWRQQVKSFDFLTGHLTISISLASVLSSMSCKTSARVFHVIGCFPLPVSHCRRTSMLIYSGSFIHWWAIDWIIAPVSSSTKVVIFNTNLLWNIDCFLCPLKSDTIHQVWFIILRTYMDHRELDHREPNRICRMFKLQ